MTRTILSDLTWERIETALRIAGAYITEATRNSVEAIFWRSRTGAPWRDLPTEFGPWQSVYGRFNRWAKLGICERLFDLLKSRAPDAEWQAIDATIVRAHQHAAGAQGGGEQEIGRSKGGPTSKIHALCDAHGNPTKIVLTPGQTHDVRRGKELVRSTETYCEALLADKAYDAAAIRDEAKSLGIKPLIPFRICTQAGREAGFDADLYRHRHIVENLFCRLKQFRAIATRYDKLARNFLAGAHIACAYLWAAL
jgi:transposase